MTDTKQRILDAAERLFASHGFAATSLRSIISAAGVNLAAVHYHFRSKEALLEAVILRRAEPVNRERLALLDAGPASLEKVIEAFLAPTVALARDPERAAFVRLMGRLHAESTEELARIVHKHFAEVLRRYGEALKRSLPEVPLPELFWRMHFSIGAMAHALCAGHQLRIISGGACDGSDSDAMLHRLVDFIAAGFRAPVQEK